MSQTEGIVHGIDATVRINAQQNGEEDLLDLGRFCEFDHPETVV